MSHKARYDHGDLSCIDAIRAALTSEEFRGFCKGNVIKYAWRERQKGGDDDLYKAEDYLHELRCGTWVDEEAGEASAQ